MKNNVNISKFMSGLLRHFPEEYNLSYNSNGWFDIEDIIECINETKNEQISKSDIENIVQSDSKGRYEIHNDKIRAVYGHSINVNIKHENEFELPDILYHGTPERNIDSILKNGLQSQSRQEVHLTDAIKEAKKVGKRHSDDIVILAINTTKLSNNGFDIKNPTGDSVYTVSEVPSEYLTVKN